MNSEDREIDLRSDPVWRFAFVLNTIIVGFVVAACAFVTVGLLGSTANCADCQTGATAAGLVALAIFASGFVAGIVVTYRTRHLRWLPLPLAVTPLAFVVEIAVYELLT